MKRNLITLDRPERFDTPYSISKAKLEAALADVVDRLEKMAKEHPGEVPGSSIGFKYPFSTDVTSWLGGLYAGCHWLAYELTGNKFFKEQGDILVQKYREMLDAGIGIGGHDQGFRYILSCIAAWKATGNEFAYETALEAGKLLYEHGYAQKGKFIIRSKKSWQGSGCRTMMDSMLNVPLLYWVGKETGEAKYTEAAIGHTKTTEDLLIRADGSSFHHYQFDPETEAPVGGLTLQGRSDDSCWSRGQAWGVYGFPIAYSYVKEQFILDVHKDITYFMLNHLPEDNIPAWDYDFTSTKAVKDSSAGVISACGMHEMAKRLSNDNPDKAIFTNAAAMILDSTIDTCTGDNGIDYDGFLFHVTGYASAKKPEKRHIDQTAVYGDFFYFEALLRHYNPDFRMYW
ncbi:MAG: glycoside hydrolase family 88 protein [Clostridia bacterium]|nr:glycoside hydrolase family 88 protein [Clostridia bacterium]